MARRERLGEFEQIVLLAVLRLGDQIGGITASLRSVSRSMCADDALRRVDSTR